MKRLLIALVAGSFAYAVAFASAATIGTVTDAGVGAGNQTVASCDDAINTAYTTEYTAGTGYTVKSVKITNAADACNGKAVSVTVSKADGSAPASGSGSIASNGATINVSPANAATDALKVFVVIG